MESQIFQGEWVYSRNDLSDRRRGSAVVVVALSAVASVGVLAIHLSTYGNILAALAFLVGLTIVVTTCYRLDWGLYLLVGMVLIFDQHEIPGYEPWTSKVAYFRNLKEIPYLPSLGAAVVNPLELHLLLLIFVWFIILCIKKHHIRLSKVGVWQTAAIFFLALTAAFVFGLRRGGDFLPALWEVRALFYLGIMLAFIPQVIQTKEQVHTMVWVLIIAIAIKALQGFARLARLGFSFQGMATLTNHEDPVFILNLIILLFALVVFGARTYQRSVLLWLLIILVMGFFSGQRRAAYAAIVPSFVAFVVVLPRHEQRFFLKTVIPVVCVGVLYCVVFWNSESKLASPVRLVKTGLSSDPETAGERYYSNLYRDIEKYNLAMTFRDHPLAGIGFGNKYEMPLPLVPINFPLRDYIPHNQVLWLIVKTGVIGFCLFWLFLNSFACNVSHIITKVSDPYLKAICAVSVAAVVNQVVVSNYDLQLTYYRNMVLLGTFMGLVSSAEHIEHTQKDRDTPERSW